MINKLIYTLISFTFFWNISRGNDSVLINRITIHYIYSLTETQYNISCNDFDVYRSRGGFMIKRLRTSAQINLFIKFLGDYKVPSLVKRIDVRAKAYIHYSNGKTSIVCIDRFGDIMLNNKVLGVSSSLLLFLKKSCKGFE
jgi:hypothetical protein